MRINKFVAARLGISRRKADELIANGRVTIDGQIPAPGQDVDETSNILVDNRPLPETKKTTTIILNKPVGYVCSRNGQGSHTIYELIPSEYGHLNPVGRLDKDSSGLLLMTNDGELHQELTHPSYQKQKIYLLTLNKPLSQTDQKHIERGVLLEDGISQLKLKEQSKDRLSWQITMHEGRNRQIRRTFAKLGYQVKKLHRTHFGEYGLGELTNAKYIDVIFANQ